MNNPRAIRRMGAVGDIHGEATLLEATLKFFNESEVDVCATTGDIVDGQADIDQCCALLKEFNVEAVRGNHEYWFLTNTMRHLPYATSINGVSEQSKEFLSSLPVTSSFDTVAGRLLLCHGLGEFDIGSLSPSDDTSRLKSHRRFYRLIRKGKFKFVVNGHSHERMVLYFDQVTMINVGALASPNEPGFAVIDFADGYVQFYLFKNGATIFKDERRALYKTF